MAQAGLTVRGTSQAGGKPEHSDPTIRIRRGGSSTDKSYSRDNRLVPPKSSYRRRSSAPSINTECRGERYEQSLMCMTKIIYTKSAHNGETHIAGQWYNCLNMVNTVGSSESKYWNKKMISLKRN